MGQTYEELDSFQLAIKCYTEAIKLDAEYYEAYLARGYCYDNIGKYQLALKDFNKAISLTGNTEDAWFAKQISNIRLAIYRNL
jgi:tetratricopeptide (TPR) repeat protein